MPPFRLHPSLAAETLFLRDLPLCQVVLMNDQRFPWLILVPRREEVTEIFELSPQDQHQLMDEVVLVSNLVKQVFNAQKINIGALGNIVSQLHIHVVGRQSTDSLWPRPVWGRGPGVAYGQDQFMVLKQGIQGFFDNQDHQV